MAIRFVASGGSNTSPYDTWAKAATSLQTALTASTGNGDLVVIQRDAVPSGDAENAADTSYTLPNNTGAVGIISATNDGGSAFTPTPMGTSYWIGNSTTSYSLAFTMGATTCSVFWYGITFRCAGSTNKNITMSSSSSARYPVLRYESCTWMLGNTATVILISGVIDNSSCNSSSTFKDCTFTFNGANHKIAVANNGWFDGCTFNYTTTKPTAIFDNGYSNHPAQITLSGCDLSALTSTYILIAKGGVTCKLINCKLATGWSAFSDIATSKQATSSLELFNSATDDTHYHFGYYDGLGEATVSTGIYATDAAANNKYDGTNRCSWKVVTTAYASYLVPFVTPWFETYCGSTSASISVSCQILRDGVNAAFLSSEVWGEWSYQGSAGFTTAVMVNDRLALGESATAATAQPSGLGVASWTGESASATSMVLSPVSQIIPKEIGMLRCRVNVGLASTTVYVDPTVRYA